MGWGDAALERLVDAGLELGGAVLVEEAQERGDDGAEMAAALGGLVEQALAVRRSLDQTILPAKAPGVTLLPGQLGDVLGGLDAGTLVEAARMGGNDVRAVEDADLVQRRDHDKGAPRMGMGDAIVIEIESGVWGLADDDLDPFVDGEAVAGQGHERAAFLLEGLAHGDGAILGPGAVGGDALAPGLGLGVEVVDVAPLPGDEEAGAYVAYGPLDAPFGPSIQLHSIHSMRVEPFG